MKQNKYFREMKRGDYNYDPTDLGWWITFPLK
jgi:hypothetical protein